LTGIAATDNVRTGILDVAGIATFRNDVNIGAAVTISESGIEASGIGITCANINGGAIGGRRNIMINGAMNVAQYGTSMSTGNGYAADRFRLEINGTDENPTLTQADVASGTTPYTLGFRKSCKVQNGNQTSGAGAADYLYIRYKVEAQDIANSGWNYTSASSYITLSFWVKSSVAQNFYGWIRTYDGTAYHYPFETGSLSADTWTKVTKTIPGNSNLQFNNDNGAGLQMNWLGYFGTDYTNNSASLDAWAATGSGESYMPDNTSTWYTTNDATLEITGVQLEVGPQATPFEHRSYGEEVALCGRYYQRLIDAQNVKALGIGFAYNGSTMQLSFAYPLGKMRTAPSIDAVTGADYWQVEGGGVTLHIDGSWIAEHSTDTQMSFYGVPDGTLSTVGLSHYVRSDNNAAMFSFSAEL